MFKRGVIAFLVLFLLSGCSSQESSFLDGKQSLENESPVLTYLQMKYYDLNEEQTSKLRDAVQTNSREECQKIADEDTSVENVELMRECFTLLVKLDALKSRDYKPCQTLYLPENTLDYEECIAPLVGESGVILKDPDYCKKYLTNERLIEVCEEEYENTL